MGESDVESAATEHDECYEVGDVVEAVGHADGDLDAVVGRLEPGCIASMFVGRVRQCFSAVWADGFPRCRHRFPVM